MVIFYTISQKISRAIPYFMKKNHLITKLQLTLFKYPRCYVLSRCLGRDYVCSLVLKMTNQNQIYENGRVSTHSDVQRGSANWKTSFTGRGNAWIKLPFSSHIANKFRRPTVFQLNIEGLTANKMNVLYHFALQSEALVILLQETHRIDAKKLILPNYQVAG